MCYTRPVSETAATATSGITPTPSPSPPQPPQPPQPARTLVLDPRTLYFSTVQVCDLLGLPRGTWVGWVSRGLAPKKDYELAGSPLWKLTTIIEYTRGAPGGRLGYPI